MGQEMSGLLSLPANMLRRIEPEPMSGCWLWSGPLDAYGYGSVSVKRAHGKWTTTKAHRVIYEMLRGPIEKPTLDHVCRVRSCVNPDHLRPATWKENVIALGSLAPCRRNVEKTHCPKCGGPFMRLKDGHRRCSPCSTAASRRWAKAHPERMRELWNRSYHRRKEA